MVKPKDNQALKWCYPNQLMKLKMLPADIPLIAHLRDLLGPWSTFFNQTQPKRFWSIILHRASIWFLLSLRHGIYVNSFPPASLKLSWISSFISSSVSIQSAEKAGATYAILANPYLGAQGHPDRVKAFFKYLCDGSDLGISLFNTAATGYSLSPELVKELVDENETICCIKNAQPKSHCDEVRKTVGEDKPGDVFYYSMYLYRGAKPPV